MRAWIIADSFLNGRERRKFDHNTYFERLSDDQIGVKLHNTFIVTISKDMPIVLNTGDWRTVTTRDRINKILRMIFKTAPVYVATRNNFMSYQGPIGGPVEFFDGMQVNEITGACVNYWNRG